MEFALEILIYKDFLQAIATTISHSSHNRITVGRNLGGPLVQPPQAQAGDPIPFHRNDCPISS